MQTLLLAAGGLVTGWAVGARGVLVFLFGLALLALATYSAHPGGLWGPWEYPLLLFPVGFVIGRQSRPRGRHHRTASSGPYDPSASTSSDSSSSASGGVFEGFGGGESGGGGASADWGGDSGGDSGGSDSGGGDSGGGDSGGGDSGGGSSD